MDTTNENTPDATALLPPSLKEAFVVWLRIGLLSFGGPAAQIALMHREIVEQKRWLTEKQYLNALSFCMLLPGPEAMQLATYAGWRLHGTIGGLIAGLLFVLPGAVVVFVLSLIYSLYGDVSFVSALFLGVKAAVVGVILNLSIWFALHVFFADVSSTNYGILKLWLPDWSSINWIVVALTVVSAVLLMANCQRSNHQL